MHLPGIHSIAAVVPAVDMMFHSNPKDHDHKEDPQGGVPAVSVSS